MTELTVTFKRKIPPIASTHKQTWVKTDPTTLKIDANLHGAYFSKSHPPWFIGPQVFSHPVRVSNTDALKPFFPPTNPKETQSQTELTHIDHLFSTQLQCKRKTEKEKKSKQQNNKASQKFIKNQESKERKNPEGNKSTTGITEKKDIIFSFLLFLLYKCVFDSPLGFVAVKRRGYKTPGDESGGRLQ